MFDLCRGASVTVNSTSGKSYEIKHCNDGAYYCSCPAWKFQRLPSTQRMCKHTIQLRGEAAEKARVEAALAGKRRPEAAPVETPVIAPQIAAHTVPVNVPVPAPVRVPQSDLAEIEFAAA